MALDEPARRTIDRYSPALTNWRRIEVFVRGIVVAVAPVTPARASMLLWAVSRLASHADAVGESLETEMFDRWSVEQFIATACGDLTTGSRNTMRSALFRVGEELLDDARTPHAARIGQSDPSAPYTPAEVVGLRSMARFQASETLRRDMSVLVALGLGAGLTAREVRGVRGCHVGVDGERVTVEVQGSGGVRRVPVLTAWCELLVGAASGVAPDRVLFGPADAGGGRGKVSNFASRLQGDVVVDSRRLRVTWMVDHLTRGTPIRDLRDAAGVSSLEPFARLLHFVPDRDGTVVDLFLRGERSLDE